MNRVFEVPGVRSRRWRSVEMTETVSRGDRSVEPRFARARSRRRYRDRLLVPVAVAKELGITVADLARAMRSAGVTEKLTQQQVRYWVAHPEQAPRWFTRALRRSGSGGHGAHGGHRAGSGAPGPINSYPGPSPVRSDRAAAELEDFLRELRALEDAAADSRRCGRHHRRHRPRRRG